MEPYPDGGRAGMHRSPVGPPESSSRKVRAQFVSLARRTMALFGVTLLCAWGLAASRAGATSPAVTESTVTSVQDNQSVTLTGIAVSGFEGAANPLLVSVSTTMGTVSMTETTGLTISDGYTFSGGSSFSFTGDEDDVNTGLASLQLTGGGSEGDATVVVDVSEEPSLGGGDSLAYDSGTGHYYEYVSDSDVTWTSAATDAEGLTYEGQSGYLAAIPNAAVNTFVTDHLNGAENVWAGGMGTLTEDGYGGDPSVVRYWTWLYGPLAGQVFTECTNWTNTCDHIDDVGDYYDWNSGEPNNDGGGEGDDAEPYIEINYGGSGDWNDYPSNGGGIDGYVAEFGNLSYGGDFSGGASSSSVVALTTTPGAPTAATATAGAGSASLGWSAPADDGGSTITSYVITPYIGATAQTTVTVSGGSTSVVVAGLSPGISYTFTIKAVNADGAGPPSPASTAVTPYAPAYPAPSTTSNTSTASTTSTTPTGPTTATTPTTVASTSPTGVSIPTVIPAPTTGGVAATPDGDGYWTVTPLGIVVPHGGADVYENAGGGTPGAQVVGIGATRNGLGYWLAGSNGSVAAFGDAHYYGSMTGRRLNRPIVQLAGTPDALGYWMAASDGGVFSFGDARFYGSLGNERLKSPVVGMSPLPSGDGYVLVSANGGVFPFGGARGYGSMQGKRLNRPIVGIVEAPDGRGYWLVAADGGVFAFGSAHFYGSLGATGKQPITAMIANGDFGYRLVGPRGALYDFGANP
jgi:hypothetical protein